MRPVVASAAFASRRRRAAALCAAVGVAALLVFAVVGLLRPTASTGQSGHDVAHTITIGDVGQNGVRYVVGRGESAWGIAAAMVSPERVGEVAALVDRATASGELVAGTVLVFDKDLVEE